VVTAAVAWRGRRAGTLAAALLVVMGLASVLSGLGDGSYTTTLTVGQRAVQIVLVTAIILTIPVAATQVIEAARRRRARTATS
jgi:cytochrome c biogenesis protein CcdA